MFSSSKFVLTALYNSQPKMSAGTLYMKDLLDIFGGHFCIFCLRCLPWRILFILKRKGFESLQELLDSAFLVSAGDECGNFLSSRHKFNNYIAYAFSFVEVMVVVGSRMKPI